MKKLKVKILEKPLLFYWDEVAYDGRRLAKWELASRLMSGS